MGHSDTQAATGRGSTRKGHRDTQTKQRDASTNNKRTITNLGHTDIQ
jgi:hypothetical protein